jgi:hypothetical protein
MKARTVLGTLGLVSAALLLAACSPKDKPADDKAKPVEVSASDLYRAEGGPGTTAGAYTAGMPGGTIINTYSVTATVAAVDPATRQITLTEPDGTKSVIKAGPAVANFDQIRVGDHVKAQVDTEVVISVRPPDGPGTNARSTTVSPAAKGEKPGVDITDTAELTGTVTAVDPSKQRATVRFPNGQLVNVKARPDVDLTKVNPGDKVVIQATQAAAINVESPQ